MITPSVFERVRATLPPAGGNVAPHQAPHEPTRQLVTLPFLPHVAMTWNGGQRFAEPALQALYRDDGRAVRSVSFDTEGSLPPAFPWRGDSVASLATFT